MTLGVHKFPHFLNLSLLCLNNARNRNLTWLLTQPSSRESLAELGEVDPPESGWPLGPDSFWDWQFYLILVWPGWDVDESLPTS